MCPPRLQTRPTCSAGPPGSQRPSSPSQPWVRQRAGPAPPPRPGPRAHPRSGGASWGTSAGEPGRGGGGWRWEGRSAGVPNVQVRVPAPSRGRPHPHSPSAAPPCFRLAPGKSGAPGRVAERADADGASREAASCFIFRGCWRVASFLPIS